MIWIIGAKGMLGAELCDQLESEGRKFIGTDIDVSILEPGVLEAFIGARPQITAIVNSSAFTTADKAVNVKELALVINAEGVKNIAAVATHSGKGRTTWYDFAISIRQHGQDTGILKKKCDIDPVSSKEFPTKATRPRFSLLDTSKIEGQYCVDVKHWDSALYEMLKSVEVRCRKFGPMRVQRPKIPAHASKPSFSSSG